MQKIANHLSKRLKTQSKNEFLIKKREKDKKINKKKAQKSKICKKILKNFQPFNKKQKSTAWVDF